MNRMYASVLSCAISFSFTLVATYGQPLLILARTSASERPGFSSLGGGNGNTLIAQINDRAQVYFQAIYRDQDLLTPDRQGLYRNDWAFGGTSSSLTRLVQVCEPVNLIPGEPDGKIVLLNDYVVSDDSSFSILMDVGDDGECGACNNVNGTVSGPTILHGHLPFGSQPSYSRTFHGSSRPPVPLPDCNTTPSNALFPCSSNSLTYRSISPLAAIGDFWVNSASAGTSGELKSILVGAIANSNDSCLVTAPDSTTIQSGPEEGNSISQIYATDTLFSLGNSAGLPWFAMTLSLDVNDFGANAIWAGRLGPSVIPDDIHRFRVMHGGESAPGSALCFSNLALQPVTCNSRRSVVFISDLVSCSSQSTEGSGLYMWREADSPRLRKLVATGDLFVRGSLTGIFTSVGSRLMPPALNALDEVVFIGAVNTCSPNLCEIHGLFRVYLDPNDMVQIETLALEGDQLFADTGPNLEYIRPSPGTGPVTNDAGDVLFSAIVRQSGSPIAYDVVARFNNRCRLTPVGNSFRALARTGQTLPVSGENITICSFSLSPSSYSVSSGSDGRPAIMNPNGQSVFFAHVSDANQSCSSTQPMWAYLFDPSLSYCAADMNQDCGVTIDDYLLFLEWYSAGDIQSDLDDGSGTGVRDGGVTIDDFLYFAFYFDTGC